MSQHDDDGKTDADSRTEALPGRRFDPDGDLHRGRVFRGRGADDLVIEADHDVCDDLSWVVGPLEGLNARCYDRQRVSYLQGRGAVTATALLRDASRLRDWDRAHALSPGRSWRCRRCCRHDPGKRSSIRVRPSP